MSGRWEGYFAHLEKDAEDKSRGEEPKSSEVEKRTLEESRCSLKLRKANRLEVCALD